MNELVQRLSEGSHPVEVVLRPEKTLETFRAALGRRNVQIKFTATRGGTELGVQIDETTSQRAIAALDEPGEAISLSGDLVLDYVPVRCVAEIDPATWQGTGHLEIRSPEEPEEPPAPEQQPSPE